jgi:hypothetical protein
MSAYGHGASVAEALARGERERARWATIAHAGEYNTRGTCVKCGAGKYGHGERGKGQ